MRAHRHAEEDQGHRHDHARLSARARCRSPISTSVKQPIGYSIDLCREVVEDVVDRARRHRHQDRVRAGHLGQPLREGEVRRGRSRMRLDDQQRAAPEGGRVLADLLRRRHQADGAEGLRGAVLPRPRRQDRGRDGRHHQRGGDQARSPTSRSSASRSSPRRDHAQSMAMLEAGKADAFATDDVLLYGFIATEPKAQGHEGRRRLPLLRSLRPGAARATIRSSPRWSSAPSQRIARERRLAELYNKWFLRRLPTGETHGPADQPAAGGILPRHRPAGLNRTADEASPLVPAKAGTQRKRTDSRFRGNERRLRVSGAPSGEPQNKRMRPARHGQENSRKP